MQFDVQEAHYDPKAFSPTLRAVSLALSIAVLGIIVFQAATTAAFIA
jgi:hypothetical protein